MAFWVTPRLPVTICHFIVNKINIYEFTKKLQNYPLQPRKKGQNPGSRDFGINRIINNTTGYFTMKHLKFTFLTLMLLPLMAVADPADMESETDYIPEPAVSVAQMLSGTSLSKGCVEDFTNILGKNNFSMANFAKELVPAVAKTKLQLKSPFGKPQDSEMTSTGLTVGCIKTLPESPAEISSLLKDISLKAGFSFVENSIPTNIETGSSGGGSAFKTVMSVSLISSGLGTLIYGFVQNSEVKDSVSKGKGKAAVDAEGSRNMSYGIGAGLLAGGLVITVFF
jgi:hypothetical protein